MLLTFRAASKEGNDAREREENHEPDNDVRMRPSKPKKQQHAGQPEPARKRRDDATTIKKADRKQVEQIQEISRRGESNEQWRVEGSPQ